MTTKFPFAAIAKSFGGVILTSLAFANLQAGTTALGTEPFTSSTKINALPNVMFVLDDSGSMEFDYLPDWAGPYRDINNAIATPTHRFFNSSYNGVAYNPATRYRPPVMYTSTGALDTSTYPSQNGQSVAQGGDATATTLSPNWRAVKKDGYGIQFNTTVNLEGNAFSYTAVAGEYCTTAQLRTCTAATAPSGLYTFPAKLRWCTTSLKAVDTTANSNGSCQASNIADTPTNTANGVTNYTFPRIAAPRTATITVNAATTLTGITVGGLQIMSASAAGATTSDVATQIASQINACTFGVPAVSNCGVVGYSAAVVGSSVIVTAPGATTATPVVAPNTSTTPGAFSVANVPGEALFTVITPSVTTYAYPGTAAKGVNRTDCSGSTCTYAEEMTNYANWYAYYRTRMQMMKSASSIAFSNVDDKFRVGFYSINNGLNGSGTYFINPSAFDGAQKFAWYSKFFSAVPYGATPLRSGLANTGRLYAGKLSTLNSVAVIDPIQYSCQQNFTILSTDGYWNDTSSPKQIDGNTAIGQQDGSLKRPYYDGGTQTRTVTQTNKFEEQLGVNTFLVESMTRQQQTATSRLTKSVVTTTSYPWKEQTTTLTTRYTPLNKNEYYLEKKTYPLTSTTRQLEERTYQLTSTTYPLERYINRLTKVTTPLEARTYNVEKKTFPLTQKIFNIKKGTKKITQSDYKISKGTSLITKDVFYVTKGTSLVTKKVFNVTATSQALQSSTYKLKSSTYQLQKRQQVSSNGGDTWVDTGWVNATSCDTTATVANSVRNIQCQYSGPTIATGLNSCTTVAASVATNYTVAQPVTCTYETTPTVATVGTCTVVNPGTTGPTYSPSVSCGYSLTTVQLSGQPTCNYKDQTGALTMTGDKVVCTYDVSPTTTVTGLSTCQWVVPTTAAASPKTECSYEGETTASGLSLCAVVARATATTNNSTWNTAYSCAYDTNSTPTQNQTTCQWVVPAAATSPKTECRYQAETFEADQTSCSSYTKNSSTADTANWNTAVTCAYQAKVDTPNLDSCSRVTPSPVASAMKTECNYQSETFEPAQTTCTRVTAGNSSATTINKAVTCEYETSSTDTPNVASCTWTLPSNVSASKTECRYATSASATASQQTTCVAVDSTVGTPITNTVYEGPKVTCNYHSNPATTLTSQSSCTWVVPTPYKSASRTDCVYTAAAATPSPNLATCTAVAASTGNTNGTIWTGPTVACNYQAPVMESTGLTTCTSGTASSGSTLDAYYTCGYGAGVAATNLNACVVDLAESGPNYSNGSYTACAYQGAVSTVQNVASCTPVLQSATFATPQKTCVYASATTTASDLSGCTKQDQSTVAPFLGPEVACAYSGTASAIVSNASSCDANRQGVSPFTGPAVDCAYNATPVTTSGVSTCSTIIQSTAPNFTGPAVTCTYGTAIGWSTATVACTELGQSDGPNYVGPARECAYTSPPVDNLVGNCTEVPQSTGPTYNQLVAKHCVGGPFLVDSTAPDVTVDSCSTDPTSTGSPITVSTATSCTYQAASIVDTPTCTAVTASSGSPFVTSVSCPVTNSALAWVAVAPTCTPAGTTSPLTFDGTGKLVECKSTDIIGSAASPVPTGTCTAGTDAVTKVQTNCRTLLSTGPTPTPPTGTGACVTANPAVGPSFIKTTCDTQTTPTTVMGCSAPAPSSPLWQTVTCVDNLGTGTSDTLADVAAYYYYTDLRTPLLNNCVGAVVSPAVTGSTLCTNTDAMNNVPTTTSDPHNFQHMTTFTLGLGASGYMKFSDTYTTDSTGDFTTVKGVSPYDPGNGIVADPTNGVCSWQANGNCNWPFPASNEQTTIDDLWHAGVNGHGAYFSATDPVSLSNSISAALSGVAAAGGAAAAPSVSTPNLSPSDNYVFSSTYTTSDWTGELVRKQIDPFTGAVSTTNDWAVQAKLNVKASRSIYTFDATVATTKLKAFTSANFATNAYFNMPHISTSPTGLTQFLCASTDICLSATDQDSSHASGGNLVDYLRGVRTWEGAEMNNTKYYRQRQHVLGDLVNASAIYVTKPQFDYADPGYATFVTNQTSRQAVVYAGANDGMLHAFAAKGSAATEALVEAAATASAQSFLDPTNATLLTAANTAIAAANTATAADTVVGQELWAYIPSMVLPNMYKLADKKYKDKHQYFVDGTPTVGDICTANCTLATAVWKTILVGGLGRGGRGYYALDITDPANPKALWEFTDTNLGYSYGNPQISKLSNGTWVVLVTSGYNNIANSDGAGGDGVGRLYVLNATTGAQIASVSPISTGVGSTGTPSGLAKITAQVLNPASDNTIEAVYGGDLLGNLWRFDVNNTIGATGYDAQLLATLKDGSDNPQPITTKPEVGLIEGNKVVFIGTGRYLAASDASDTSQQSLYAIKDVRSPTSIPGTAIFDNPGGSPRVAGTSSEGFVRQIQSETTCSTRNAAVGLCTAGSTVLTSTKNPVIFGSDNGWFVDFIYSSERANTDPALALGLLAVNTNAPSLLACDVGGKSYSYFLDYLTGGPIVSPGNGDPADGNNGIVGRSLANELASAPSIAITKSGKLIILTGLSGGGINSGGAPQTPLLAPTKRTSWRELIRGN